MYRCLTLYEHFSFVLSEKCVLDPILHNQHWPIKNYNGFVKLPKPSSRKNIPQRCCTKYIQSLPNDAKDLYKEYTQHYEGDPFGTDTLECEDTLTNSIM